MAGSNWVRVVLVQRLRERTQIHFDELSREAAMEASPEADAAAGALLGVLEQLDELMETAGG